MPGTRIDTVTCLQGYRTIHVNVPKRELHSEENPILFSQKTLVFCGSQNLMYEKSFEKALLMIF